MTQGRNIDSLRTPQLALLRTTVLCCAVLCSVVFFQAFSQPVSAQEGEIPREHITFVDASGRPLSYAEVQGRMVAFNEYTRRLFLGNSDPATAKKLKIISLNAGMLNVLNMVNVPKYAERGRYLIPALKRADFDVLCLQEIFYARELRALQEFAQENGYYFYRGNPGIVKNRHGLVILVKKSLSPEGPPTFREHRFRTIAWYERIFGYQKGMLTVELSLGNGRTLGLINSHLTAFIMRKEVRGSQLQDMLRVLNAMGSDYTILSGDLNATMGGFPDGSSTHMNVVQQLISTYHTVDTYSAIHPGKDEPTVSSFENPLAEHGITTNLDQTDEERIDFILATSRKDSHVLTEDNQRVFTEDIPVKIKPKWWAFWRRHKSTEAKNCKLSDHFGVLADLTLF